MKLRYLIGTLLVGLGIASACTQEKFETLSELKVSESYVAINVNGGSTEIQLTATGSWQVDEASLGDWLTVSPMSGAAGTTAVIFTAQSTGATRTAEVKINCANATQFINVIQYAQKVDPVVMTVAEAVALIKTVDKGDGQSYNLDGEYCVKGIVCRVDEISPSYGNATYYLSDNGKFEDGKWLEVYRGYWTDSFHYFDDRPELREGPAGTFNGWKPDMKLGPGRRIDYIYFRGKGVQPLRYCCDASRFGGLMASDHYPVFVDFNIKK